MKRNNGNFTHKRKVVGLLPAAGKATRLGRLPCSKELLPIGFDGDAKDAVSLKSVSEYLLEKMRKADITEVFIILRKGKWDIPAFLSSGTALDMNLAYLLIDHSPGVPFTLDQAYPFIHDAMVAFGFPDIIFGPDNAFVKLISKQKETHADIVLGIFPIEHPEKWDTVEFDSDGWINRVAVKSFRSTLRYAWIIALWTPVFTDFIHNYVIQMKNPLNHPNKTKGKDPREVYIGDVIQAAIQKKCRVNCVRFDGNSCLDIGTSEDMIKALLARDKSKGS